MFRLTELIPGVIDRSSEVLQVEEAEREDISLGRWQAFLLEQQLRGQRV